MTPSDLQDLKKNGAQMAAVALDLASEKLFD